MKLRILSDLHLEFDDFEPPRTEADVVVLAGDIDLGVKGIAWAAEQFPTVPVVYVLGNHEYYGKAFPRLVQKMRSATEGTTVSVLERDSVELAGVRFLGCTYWTDFSLLGDPRIAGYHATQSMTDYKKIRVSPQYRKLRSLDTAADNQRSAMWLEQEVRGAEEQPLVVVTHHAPSHRSLPAAHETDLLSAAYASNHDDFVESTGALLWIHGHVHAPCDYYIGGTRVVCNPRGYPDEPVEGFLPDLVVDIVNGA